MRVRPIIRNGLYVITEHTHLDFSELVSISKQVLETGISLLQYRNKNADSNQRFREASVLLELCRQYDTPLIINDDVELALELQAEGVHLGSDDTQCKKARDRLGNDVLIGISCNNDFERVRLAVIEGADYVAIGAMFPTITKDETVKASPQLITQVKQNYDIPVIAIGGITSANCMPILKAGADLLAVISSVYLSANPTDTVKKFNNLIGS